MNVKAAIIAQAAAEMAKYPQYADHWNGYRVGYMKRDVRTKMGLAFLQEEIVLIAPARETDSEGFLTVWSSLNAVDTSVPASKVVEIDLDAIPADEIHPLTRVVATWTSEGRSERKVKLFLVEGTEA